MNDKAISLNAAIDALNKRWGTCILGDDIVEGCVKVLNSLPPAQPEIIYCKNCMFWQRDRISCEGYARCQTGEGGIRFRQKNDFCSKAERRIND